jgi:hypothetical protein
MLLWFAQRPADGPRARRPAPEPGRATAQRYLADLVRHGLLNLSLNYGTAGRPNTAIPCPGDEIRDPQRLCPLHRPRRIPSPTCAAGSNRRRQQHSSSHPSAIGGELPKHAAAQVNLQPRRSIPYPRPAEASTGTAAIKGTV